MGKTAEKKPEQDKRMSSDAALTQALEAYQDHRRNGMPTNEALRRALELLPAEQAQDFQRLLQQPFDPVSVWREDPADNS